MINLDLFKNVSDEELLKFANDMDNPHLSQNEVVRNHLKNDSIFAFSQIQTNVILKHELAKRFRALLEVTKAKEAKYNFVDVQETKKLHPDTFQAPNLDNLIVELAKKTCVACKISCDNERFWVSVVKYENGVIHGVIDNDLIFTKKHGLKDKDTVSFRPEHVFDFV